MIFGKPFKDAVIVAPKERKQKELLPRRRGRRVIWAVYRVTERPLMGLGNVGTWFYVREWIRNPGDHIVFNENTEPTDDFR